MSGQTQHSPVKISNLPDKCPMTGANLQACSMVSGPFHSLLRDFGIGNLRIFVLAPQSLVLKADSKHSLYIINIFLKIGNLISYFIFLFNHFCFFRLI